MTLNPEQRSRYARHILLPEVGLAGQERLGQAKVLCIGAGGLGSPALCYLAAAGVGHIGIADNDRVDSSNLQRQIVHSEKEIGELKTHSARRRLEAINSSIKITTYEVRVDSTNVTELLKGYDLVIDGSDNLHTRYGVSDAAAMAKIPYIYGAVFGFEGQVSVFNYKDGPTYRDLYPTPPPAGSTPSCADAGVLGVLPGIIGTLQATEAIKVILGLGKTLSGRLLLFDALAMRFRDMAITPSVDKQQNIQRMIDDTPKSVIKVDDMEKEDEIAQLEVELLKLRQDAGWNPCVLDVRTIGEVEISTLPFTTHHIPLQQLGERLSELNKEQYIVIYCKVGMRSQVACQFLQTQGFSKLYNLAGGINAWRQLIDPTLADY